MIHDNGVGLVGKKKVGYQNIPFIYYSVYLRKCHTSLPRSLSRFNFALLLLETNREAEW